MSVHFNSFLNAKLFEGKIRKAGPLKGSSKAVPLCTSSYPNFTHSTRGANQAEQIISEK